MPPFLLSLLASRPAQYAIAIGAALVALAVAVFRLIGMGRKQQQAADAKVTTDILEKQRDEANKPPVGRDALDGLMRDGKL